ncbi:hypothetical protein RRG08_045112 [Elysia crispata]|uniref:Uncharacterized protein n=1 Tax=Elysia crispata TaxID=231223 RepID=A0AAE1D4L5_9GAST|nr:hypothetical protein RRG08_045112 [Elysia crispata]
MEGGGEEGGGYILKKTLSAFHLYESNRSYITRVWLYVNPLKELMWRQGLTSWVGPDVKRGWSGWRVEPPPDWETGRFWQLRSGNNDVKVTGGKVKPRRCF